MSAAQGSGGGPKPDSSAADTREEQSIAAATQSSLVKPPTSLADIRARRQPEETEVLHYQLKPADFENHARRAGIHRMEPEQGGMLTNPSLSDPANIKHALESPATSIVREKAKVVERTAKLDEEIPRLLAMKKEMQNSFFRDESSPDDLDETLVSTSGKSFSSEDLQALMELEEDDALEHTLTGEGEIPQHIQELHGLSWQQGDFDVGVDEMQKTDNVEVSAESFDQIKELLTLEEEDELEEATAWGAAAPDEEAAAWGAASDEGFGEFDETTAQIPASPDEEFGEFDEITVWVAAAPGDISREITSPTLSPETGESGSIHRRELGKQLPQLPEGQHEIFDNLLDETMNVSSDELNIPDSLVLPNVLDIGDVQDDDDLSDTLILRETKK